MKYNPKEIEQKWQQYWEENQSFQAKEKGKKYYTLLEFPYPSGDGLHVGHLRPYIALDVVSRHQRMNGFDVLFPIGMDAFGLPTENYAIKHNISPQVATEQNTATFIRQLKSEGISFDWSRYLSTTDEDYYKWTQWIFIQMFKKGLAYKAKETINWCTKCKIGLANEEVVGGACERCSGKVVKKEKEQWLLKITKYADRLIEGLEKVDFLPRIKKQQIDWIGRSAGAEVYFKVKGTKDKLNVFTTRPDTLFGVTFMVLAPEHPLVAKLKDKIKNYSKVEKYVAKAKEKSDVDRSTDKTGVKLEGLTAINPVNNEELPIFVADYVTMTYGTGAIMAVPGHDQRDYEFAQKHKLEIRCVVIPVTGEPHKGEEYRETVSAVVQRKSDKKFLLVKWKKFKWVAPAIGGIKEGETPAQAAERELLEETGYKAKAIKQLDVKTEEHFYAENKKIWRHRVDTPVLLELTDDKPVDIDSEEQAKHEVVWLSEVEAIKQITHEYNKIGILQYLEKYEAYSGEGRAMNSGEYDGLLTKDFQTKIIKWLEKNKLGKATINYKLHDWIFSRQRYWGEPIPMVYCEKCNWQPVDEKDLPVVLPDVEDFKPTDDGSSPLAKLEDWVNTTCPKCKGKVKRETDVMPNWAGSNWYFVRYCDSKNSKKLADGKKIKHWLPVDWYNGGMEHTTLHLLYSRFVFKFLYDIGVIPKSVGDEPYKKRTAQGMILGEGGIKMSKSKGNVKNPDDYVSKFGADTVRLYEMFMGPFDQAIAWDDKGVMGVHRFLNRIWELQDKIGGNKDSKEVTKVLHQTIRKVSDDIMTMRFNTAVAQMMILVNALEKQKNISTKLFSQLVLILSPFAPHLAEELWKDLGNKKSLANEKWPEYDKKLAKEENITLAIQVNAKVRDTIDLPIDTEPSKEIEKEVLNKAKIENSIGDKKVVKFIHVKNKIISIVVK